LQAQNRLNAEMEFDTNLQDYLGERRAGKGFSQQVGEEVIHITGCNLADE
jgi:hypothetical protein